MNCPKCKSSQTAITDSRQSGKTRRRRHQCLACGHLFTTYEICKEEFKKQPQLSNLLAELTKAGAEHE